MISSLHLSRRCLARTRRVATVIALGLTTVGVAPVALSPGASAAAPTTPLVFGAAAGQTMNLSTGVTHGAYSADTYENSTAVARARKLLSAEPVYQNQAIMGFGVGNPEPAPGVYNWSRLDERMNLIKSTGGIPVITLVGAPDWMKGGTDGTTDYNDVPYAPSPAHYADFAHLAVMVARRYPWVKYFQIWNEMKGFWDSAQSRWDYVQYTNMYNVVYDALKQYNPNLQIGGPYVTVQSSMESSPPAGSLTGAWGTVDPRSLQVIEYWLTHKAGAQFISVDAQAVAESGGTPADEFTSDQKFAAIDAWIRQRTALPIWWSEFYDQPAGTSWTTQHQDAAITTAMAEMAISGASVALIWSPEGSATDPTQRAYLWSYADVSTGGEPTPLYSSFESFNTDFSPADDGGTSADDVTVVINPTDSDLAYGSTTLTPYEVEYITGNSATETGPTAADGGTGAQTVSAGAASSATINTIAGGVGTGIAMHVAQSPDAVAVGDDHVYVTDPVADVVRSVSLSQTVATKRLETVFAGDGIPGNSGNGGPAVDAHLKDPEGVAVNSAGDVYISDTGNNEVKEVTPNGDIAVVAGNGVYGYSGDNGLAVDAHLAHPTALAVDSSGDLFIVDDGNNVIREVTPTGIISTVAGNGDSGYSGNGGQATSAELDGPTGVAVDSSGDIFISDGGNNVIREVNTAGVISTVAGNGTQGYSGDGAAATSAELDSPEGVAVDGSGDIFIADAGNSRVREVNTAGAISTVAGNGTQGYSGDGGAATSAELNNPNGVAVDAEGDLWIVDRDNRRIREVNTSGIISSPIGEGLFDYSGNGGGAVDAEMDDPTGIAVNSAGDIYFSDSLDNVVREILPDGDIVAVAGDGNYGYSGNGGPATSAELWDPLGLAVDSAGNLYIADFYNNVIRKVTPAGIISTVAGYGTYGFRGDGGGATKAWMEGPTAVAVNSAGDMFIADTGNDRIREVTPAWGEITTVAGDGIEGDTGDGGAATSAQLDDPTSLAVNAAGDVFVADSVNNEIRELLPDGDITNFAGDGTAGYSGDGGPATSAELSSPEGVAVDAAGDVFIADTGNDRIREVNTDGVITTVAGDGAIGATGDGGPANWAALAQPNAVAVGSTGDVFISDTGDDEIREVS